MPPEEAIRFFESKGFRIGFDWRDTWAEEHARAFTVAKVMRHDILEDIRRAVDTALREGQTLRQFQTALTPTLIEKGWWGRKTLAELPVADAFRDQVLGETTGIGEDGKVQLGSPRRLRVIYDTNLRTARAAGRWARMERLKDRLPFLRYSAVLDGRTRPLHRSWHGTVLAIDHEWWRTHYPPNGWNCRCIAQQFGEEDLKAAGFEITPQAPDNGTFRWVNKRTGAVLDIPRGIDPGFGHNVGLAHMQALTPPAPTGPLSLPAIGVAAGPLPPARTKPASRLLPREAAAMEGNVDAFLGAFGAARGKPAVFADALGEPVVISESFFTRPDGSSKLASGLRREAMLLLADAIREPDEIWWQWEEIALADGSKQSRLRRRYIARFDVEGRAAPMIIVMDIGKDGWRGITAFRADAESNFRNARVGVLAFRRK